MSKKIATYLLLLSSALAAACSEAGSGSGGGGSTSSSSSSGSTSSSSGATSSSGSTSSSSSSSSSSTSSGAGGSSTSSTGGTVIGAKVVINEVAPDPELGTDWFELYNAGDQTADLTGWTMTDDDPTHVFTFVAGTTVAPGAYLTLEQNAADSFTFGLGKGGDQVNIYDGQAALVDNATWTTGQADTPTTWGRLPNGTGAFQTLAAASKGAANQ